MKSGLQLLYAVIAATLFFAAPTGASATERRALLIGVSDYPRESLANPVKDIGLIGASLEGAGFTDVAVKPNLSTGTFKKAVRDFAKDIATMPTGSIAFFYFSGHGFQADGNNYLMPAGTEIHDEPDISDSMINAQWVLDTLHANGKHGVKIIFVIDACRNNPPVALANQPTGMASVKKPDSNDIIVAYSASPGQSASDGRGTRGGPYAVALAAALATEDIDVSGVFEQTRRTLVASGSLQTPFHDGHIGVRLKLGKAPPKSYDAIIQAVYGDTAGQAVAASGPARQKGPAPAPSTLENKVTDVGKCAELVAPIGQNALEDRAMKGMDPIDLLCAGWPYVDGDRKAGVEQNYARAIYFMRYSAARGNSSAINGLGLLACCRTGGPKNDAEGYAWFRVAESMGNLRALRNIGVHYRDGIVVKRDFDEAERLFATGAERGDTSAWRYLGYLYEDAKFLRADRAKAREFFRKAYDADPSSADNAIGYAASLRWGIKPDGSDRDMQAAFDVYADAAANGCLTCWWEAGQIADDTTNGTGDPELAKELYRQGDAAGHAESSSFYADILTRGKDKPEYDKRNLKPAFEAYSRAAAGGFADSEVKVALALARGEGVARDAPRAEASLRALLNRENDTDPAVLHAIYTPNYWAMGKELGNLIEDGLIKPRDAGELAGLRARYGKRGDGMKRFTVPIQCGTTKSPFHIYVVDWDRPNDETSVDSQAEWVKHARGCTFPADVLTSFTKLKVIARENSVSFTELTVYALSPKAQKAADDAKAKEATAAKPK